MSEVMLSTATSYMMVQAIICFMKHEYTEWIWKRRKQNESSGSIECRARFWDHCVFHITVACLKKFLCWKSEKKL